MAENINDEAKAGENPSPKIGLSPLDWRDAFEEHRFPTAKEIAVVFLIGIFSFSCFLIGEQQKLPKILVVALNIFGWLAIVPLGMGSWNLFARLFQDITKPFRPFCPHCGKYLPTSLDWKCGFCDYANSKTQIYSFLYQCECCKAEPKAYRCQHCDEVIFLDKNNDDTHCAMVLQSTTEKTKPNEPSIHELRRNQLDEKDHKLTLTGKEIALERAAQELKALQARRKEERLSRYDLLKKSAKDNREHSTGVHRIVAEDRKQAEEDYKDNPHMLQVEYHRIESWAAQVLGEVLD